MVKLGRELKIFFEDLGGIYLKFGQILALRIDLLPIEVCNELRALFDSVKPFEFNHTERVFNQDFNKKISEVFKEFPKPNHQLQSARCKARLKTVEVAKIKTEKGTGCPRS
jgi:ubiquinone biosynthesis protein